MAWSPHHGFPGPVRTIDGALDRASFASAGRVWSRNPVPLKTPLQALQPAIGLAVAAPLDEVVLAGLVVRGLRHRNVFPLGDPVTALAERADCDLEPVVARHPCGQLPGAVRVFGRLNGPSGKVQGPGIHDSFVPVVPGHYGAFHGIGERGPGLM